MKRLSIGLLAAVSPLFLSSLGGASGNRNLTHIVLHFNPETAPVIIKNTIAHWSGVKNLPLGIPLDSGMASIPIRGLAKRLSFLADTKQENHYFVYAEENGILVIIRGELNHLHYAATAAATPLGQLAAQLAKTPEQFDGAGGLPNETQKLETAKLHKDMEQEWKVFLKSNKIPEPVSQK